MNHVVRAERGVKRTAVFLDRDGTLIREKGYLKDPGQLELEPGAAEAVRLLNRVGMAVVLVTNQSGIARGYFTERDVEAVHRALEDRLSGEGARLDAVYVCPHHPEGVVEPFRRVCTCRKPALGLLHRAGEELGILVSGSYLIGDKRTDMQCARDGGLVGVLVTTGYGMQEWEASLADPESPEPDLVAGSLSEAVAGILEEQGIPLEGQVGAGGTPRPFSRTWKYISLRHLLIRLAAERARGHTVVLANGVFDLFHAGHAGYLQEARRLGDVLVVAVNDDGSTRELKGPGRPVFPVAERIAILSALGCVDYCLLLRERTADRLLEAIRPAVHAKGADYTEETVPERETVKRFGGNVKIVGPPKRRSTTDILKILRGQRDG
jgi:D-glycero-D-manno-heptose 1,7-bisphosphate phosphatase